LLAFVFVLVIEDSLPHPEVQLFAVFINCLQAWLLHLETGVMMWICFIVLH